MVCLRVKDLLLPSCLGVTLVHSFNTIGFNIKINKWFRLNIHNIIYNLFNKITILKLQIYPFNFLTHAPLFLLPSPARLSWLPPNNPWLPSQAPQPSTDDPAPPPNHHRISTTTPPHEPATMSPCHRTTPPTVTAATWCSWPRQSPDHFGNHSQVDHHHQCAAIAAAMGCVWVETDLDASGWDRFGCVWAETDRCAAVDAPLSPPPLIAPSIFLQLPISYGRILDSLSPWQSAQRSWHKHNKSEYLRGYEWSFQGRYLKLGKVLRYIHSWYSKGFEWEPLLPSNVPVKNCSQFVQERYLAYLRIYALFWVRWWQGWLGGEVGCRSSNNGGGSIVGSLTRVGERAKR